MHTRSATREMLSIDSTRKYMIFAVTSSALLDSSTRFCNWSLNLRISCVLSSKLYQKEMYLVFLAIYTRLIALSVLPPHLQVCRVLYCTTCIHTCSSVRFEDVKLLSLSCRALTWIMNASFERCLITLQWWTAFILENNLTSACNDFAVELCLSSSSW